MAAFDFDTETIAGLNAAMAEGRTSARHLLETCLERIEATDPRTRAVLELRDDARACADRLDRERRAGRLRGPLHGIPILVKDNFDTADGMVTSAGSLALANHRARRDAAAVERLRAAGALLFGKTNLSEWANFRATRSVSGWSSRGGQTRNPHVLDRSPGGSSSGSAVAVAAGYCVAALGTETDGSIVSPAAMNGIVGLKPTLGLVSRRGIVPISRNQDTAGPMTRHVADAALLLEVLAGTDAADPATREADVRRAAFPARLAEAATLRGARIGAVRMLASFHDGVATIFEEAVRMLRDAGAEIVEDVRVVPPEELRDSEYRVLIADFAADLGAYLAALGDHAEVRSLADLVAFNRSHAERVMPWFGQDLLERALEAEPVGTPAYRRAREICLRLARRESIELPIERHRLDALIAPTISPAWPIDWILGDHRIGSSAYLAAISGCPGITVPAGHLHGLPVGLSMIGPRWSEPRLLALAHAFERRRQARMPPRFAETVLPSGRRDRNPHPEEP